MNDIHGKLVAACAHGEWIVVDGLEVLDRGIAHSTRSEIYESSLHSDEREGDVVEWHILLVVLGPLDFLHAEATFKVDDVWISAVDACWLIDAVVVEHQMVFGTDFSNAVNHFHTFLVVAVEEIHLESSNAHVRIGFADCFEIVVKNVEHGPENDADSLLFAVCNEFGQIEFGNDREHVVDTWLEPTFVENDVVETVLRSKVNVVLIGWHIDASLEIHTAHAPVVPPVPSHFSWLNP